MSKRLALVLFARVLSLIAPLMAALPAAAHETILLCRFSKFTVTESSATPGRMKTIRETSLAIPRSILLSVDPATKRVSTPQTNMLLERATLENGQVAAHIMHASDRSWLFGEEAGGDGVLIVDLETRIGSVMGQLKSENSNKLALSAGDCRPFRMQELVRPRASASLE